MAAIRPAEAHDLLAMQRVERLAGEPFRALGMDAVADDDPPPLEHLARHQEAGRAWVAVDGDNVVAYLVLDIVDDTAHIEQVSVEPAYARQRIGQRLIDAAADWAVRHGLHELTLTTFADVPWNAPYYARLGFSHLPDVALPPGLAAVRAAERARGLDRWPRVAMARELHGSEETC